MRWNVNLEVFNTTDSSPRQKPGPSDFKNPSSRWVPAFAGTTKYGGIAETTII